MCFIPSSDEFECQGQRSRSPGTKTGKLLRHPNWQCIVRCSPYTASDIIRQQMAPLRRSLGVTLMMACVWSMFCKTSLALFFLFLFFLFGSLWQIKLLAVSFWVHIDTVYLIMSSLLCISVFFLKSYRIHSLSYSQECSHADDMTPVYSVECLVLGTV